MNEPKSMHKRVHIVAGGHFDSRGDSVSTLCGRSIPSRECFIPWVFTSEGAHCKTCLKKLDVSFYRARFDRLTPAEKECLRAMPGLGPTRSALIGKGMVYSPQHGDPALTVPLSDQFLRRVMPVGNP